VRDLALKSGFVCDSALFGRKGARPLAGLSIAGLEPQGDIVGIYFDGSNLACSSIPSDWRIFTAGWPNALNVPGTSALSPERGQYKFYGDV
jgi:hypothetical protein